MEIKKNNKANLERSKSMFLIIGLIAAFSFLTFAFNWKSEYLVDIPTESGSFPPEPGPPVTVPEPPQPKPEKLIAKNMIKDIIVMVEKKAPVDTIDYYISEFEEEEYTFEEIPEPEEIIYDFAEKSPEFPGGIYALRKFVAKHVVYPDDAVRNLIEGTVHVRFEVTKTGRIGKIEIQNKKVDLLLQEAATDVIKMLPKFKPGMQNGEYVNVWYTMPISFKLN